MKLVFKKPSHGPFLHSKTETFTTGILKTWEMSFWDSLDFSISSKNLKYITIVDGNFLLDYYIFSWLCDQNIQSKT